MKCKRLLSFLLPTAVLLSGCQQVLAADHLSENSLMLSRDVKSYHQTVSLQTEIESTISEKEVFYSITEATLFPEESFAYGSRITKDKDITPSKLNLYGSKKEGAFLQKDNGEWIPSATVEPIFTSLEIYPYQTFVELSEIFAEKGSWIESGEEFKIDYSGVDIDINQKVATLLGELPISKTHYHVSISLNKNSHRLTSLSYQTEVEYEQKKVTQELEISFSNYNLITEQSSSQKLQSFIQGHPQLSE